MPERRLQWVVRLVSLMTYLAVLINKSHSFILGAMRTIFQQHALVCFASLFVSPPSLMSKIYMLANNHHGPETNPDFKFWALTLSSCSVNIIYTFVSHLIPWTSHTDYMGNIDIHFLFITHISMLFVALRAFNDIHDHDHTPDLKFPENKANQNERCLRRSHLTGFDRRTCPCAMCFIGPAGPTSRTST